jgi:hypothetical protein
MRGKRDRYGEEAAQLWLDTQKLLAAGSSRSKHAVSTNSGHFVQGDEPQLVIDAIETVLDSIRHPAGPGTAFGSSKP